MAEEPPKSSASYMQSIRSSASYIVPCLTSLKDACHASYNYTQRAVGTLNKAMKGVFGASYCKIGSLMPDPQTRETIGRALAGASLSAASTALDEFSGLIPGGRSVCRVAKAGSSEFSKIYRGGGAGGAVGGVERNSGEIERELDELEVQNRMPMEQMNKNRSRM